MENNFREECKKEIIAVHDAMDLLSGRWKISIIASLCYHPSRRFSEILRDVNGISNKMLSKELKDLETNMIVKRTVLDTQPIAVAYSLTSHGQKLHEMIENLSKWGKEHRKKLFGQTANKE